MLVSNQTLRNFERFISELSAYIRVLDTVTILSENQHVEASMTVVRSGDRACLAELAGVPFDEKMREAVLRVQLGRLEAQRRKLVELGFDPSEFGNGKSA